MQDCPELLRVTTEYVVTEDRIRLSGATPDEQTVVLWLTQRMLNLLAPQLTGWLERQGAADSALMQEFAQQAAVAALTAEPAVQAASAEAAWCVVSVDIGTGPDGVSLIFKSDDETRTARLALPTEALRQWLGIVRGQYVAGGWPTGAWPVWMDETNVAAPTQTAALH